MMDRAIAANLRCSAEHYYRDVLGLRDWRGRVEGRVRRDYETYMSKRLERFSGALDGKTVLDLGCGWGGIVIDVAKSSRIAVGVEPDVSRTATADQLLKKLNLFNGGIICGKGEHLPFKNNSFDVVASYQVLEHVACLDRVVREVARTTKVGGIFHFTTPNYMSFREPHYKIFWLPFMPKRLGRVYLSILGYNPDFINHINYVNPITIRHLLRRNEFQYVDVWHSRALSKIENLFPSSWANLPILSYCNTLLRLILNVFVFVAYTCFWNKEQEFIATKK
jgi:ubiquinone/menaquinone biosynthesis C-methylase UbiE